MLLRRHLSFQHHLTLQALYRKLLHVSELTTRLTLLSQLQSLLQHIFISRWEKCDIGRALGEKNLLLLWPIVS